jgi:hypothetical protein
MCTITLGRLWGRSGDFKCGHAAMSDRLKLNRRLDCPWHARRQCLINGTTDRDGSRLVVTDFRRFHLGARFSAGMTISRHKMAKLLGDSMRCDI